MLELQEQVAEIGFEIGLKTAKAKAPYVLHLAGVRYIRADALQGNFHTELQKLYLALEDFRNSDSFDVSEVNNSLDEMLAMVASLIVESGRGELQNTRNAGWK